MELELEGLHIAFQTRSSSGSAPSSPISQNVVGLDLNKKALQFAQANTSLYTSVTGQSNIREKIDWRESNLFSALTVEEKEKLDLVISNPPYIAFEPSSGQGSTYDEYSLKIVNNVLPFHSNQITLLFCQRMEAMKQVFLYQFRLQERPSSTFIQVGFVCFILG